jgi:hypothetical protein
MKSLEIDININEKSSTMRNQIKEVIRTRGLRYGTGSIPLATECFEWLEEQGKLADILDFGNLCLPLLENFLEVCL